MAKGKHSSAYLDYLNSEGWKSKSRWVRGLTGNRCCLFPFLRANQAHHLTYYWIGKLGWNDFGFELPVVHLVPLSEIAHKIVHFPLLWKQPIRFLVNTYLRVTFVLLEALFKLLWAIPFWFGVYWLWQNYLSDKVMPWIDLVRDLIQQAWVVMSNLT